MVDKYNEVDVINQLNINIERFEKSMNKKLSKRNRGKLMLYFFVSLFTLIDNELYNKHRNVLDNLLDELESLVESKNKIEYIENKFIQYKSFIDEFMLNEEVSIKIINEFYSGNLDTEFKFIFTKNLIVLMNSCVEIANNLDD